MTINVNDLTIGQAKEIAALVAAAPCSEAITNSASGHAKRPVVVCTDKRGVVFGYTDNVNARPIVLTDARMCLYWSAGVGGVFGLGEKGPNSSCNISATLSEITLEGVTAIMSVDPAAEKAWIKAAVKGR